MDKVGRWAFIAGLVISVLGAFLPLSWFGLVLVVLGLIVGFLNVTAGEAQGFLIAAIGLTISAAAVQGLPFVGELVTNMVGSMVVFIAPAILVVAIKALLETARM